jgi:hypothetical protein
MIPAGLEPENDSAGEDQQQLYMTDPSSRQRGCYIRAITARVQLKIKIIGRESQGACRQDWLAVNRQSLSNSDSDSGPVSRELSSAREAVKTGSERVELKNFHC